MCKIFFYSKGIGLIFNKNFSDSFLLYKNVKQIIPIVILLNILITSCVQNNDKKTLQLANSTNIFAEIPNLSIDKTNIKYNNKTSMFLLDNQPFSGYIVSFYQDSTLKEKIGIFNGKKQNRATFWYSSGALKQ